MSVVISKAFFWMRPADVHPLKFCSSLPSGSVAQDMGKVHTVIRLSVRSRFGLHEDPVSRHKSTRDIVLKLYCRNMQVERTFASSRTCILHIV